MYQFSDSDSVDSDRGIRYKTDSIRNKDRPSVKDLSNKRDSYSSRREKRRSRSRSPRHHQSKRKKLKRRSRDRSSEGDDDERGNSRRKERKKEKKDGKRHRERQRESDSPYKKTKPSKDYCESSSSENKTECPQISDVTIKNNYATDQNVVLGPALPPHLLQKDNIDDKNIGFKSKQTLIDSSNSFNSSSSDPKSNLPDDSCASERKSDRLMPVLNETAGKIIGPALPQSLIRSTVHSDVHDPEIPVESNRLVGPALPPDLNPLEDIDTQLIGPTYPDAAKSDGNVIGPALPPDLNPLEDIDTQLIGPTHPDAAKSEGNVIGPALPPSFRQQLTENHTDSHQKEIVTVSSAHSPDLEASNVSDDRVIGPTLHPDIRKKLAEANSYVGESSEEDDVYGPVPVGTSVSGAHLELEERALKLKIHQLEPEGDKQPTREEWMMTLPEARAAKFGLGPRSFRAKAGPDLSDRSSWTDTPEDKAKKKTGKVEQKVDLQREAELKAIRQRNEEQEAIAKKSKKHKESLLDIHQKKLKKEKSESGPSERRPFSREIDLQVNRFDEAQKKAVLKKAQLLDSRFSTGESKYL